MYRGTMLRNTKHFSKCPIYGHIYGHAHNRALIYEVVREMQGNVVRRS